MWGAGGHGGRGHRIPGWLPMDTNPTVCPGLSWGAEEGFCFYIPDYISLPQAQVPHKGLGLLTSRENISLFAVGKHVPALSCSSRQIHCFPRSLLTRRCVQLPGDPQKCLPLQ